MVITGYKLREAIKQWQLKKDALERIFDDSIKAFPGDNKPHPASLIESYLEAEMAIAKLQTLQVEYNLRVHIDFEGRQLTLSQAIKSIGGLARVEKMWRKAAGEKSERYSGYINAERDPTKEYLEYVVSPSESVEKALKAAKRASALRSAIALANAKEQPIVETGLEKLFD